MRPGRHGVLIPVSRGCPPAWGRLPTRYSPVRRSPHFRSTEISLPCFPLDLHVLGTPPAFILSQDQTLSLMVSKGRMAFKPGSFFGLSACAFSLFPNYCFVFFGIVRCFCTMKFSRSLRGFAPRAARLLLASHLISYFIKDPLSTVFFPFFNVFFIIFAIPIIQYASIGLIRLCPLPCRVRLLI